MQERKSWQPLSNLGTTETIKMFLWLQDLEMSLEQCIPCGWLTFSEVSLKEEERRSKVSRSSRGVARELTWRSGIVWGRGRREAVASAVCQVKVVRVGHGAVAVHRAGGRRVKLGAGRHAARDVLTAWAICRLIAPGRKLKMKLNLQTWLQMYFNRVKFPNEHIEDAQTKSKNEHN
jgi:hypothetical protein